MVALILAVRLQHSGHCSFAEAPTELARGVADSIAPVVQPACKANAPLRRVQGELLDRELDIGPPASELRARDLQQRHIVALDARALEIQ